MKKININEYKKYQGMSLILIISVSAAVSCVITALTIMVFFLGTR